MTKPNDIPVFSKEDFDEWKIRMKIFLAAQDDDLWDVITDSPIRSLKDKCEWSVEEKRMAKIDNMAINILYKSLDKSMFSKIKFCTSAKEIWERLIQLCEGSEQNKENMKMAATQKLDSIRMYSYETLDEFDERFTSTVIELSSLGKTYTNREIIIKAMRALSKEWDIKIVAMREAKDLNKMELHEFFFEMKAFEFEKDSRKAEEAGRTKKRARLDIENKRKSGSREPEPNSTKPKKQKVLFAAKNLSSWDETDSEDEQTTIKCLLANNVEEDFDFGSEQFSKEELTEALNDMVIEYKKLSERLLEVQAENLTLKQQAEIHQVETETEPAEAESSISELNGLREVNSKLTKTILEKDFLIQKLNANVSAWTSSSTSLESMLNEQRPARCKFGLGYSEAEAETSKTDGFTKVGKTMQFVKSTCVDTLTEGFGLANKTEPNSCNDKKQEMISWLKPKVRAARCSKPKRKPAVFKQKNGLKFYGKYKTIPFGKRVRIIKVWIPKGIINYGPN